MILKKMNLCLIVLIAILLLTRTTYAANIDLDEAGKAAENFETLLFSSDGTKNLISFVDVSMRDGHLILWIKKGMLRLKEKTSNDLYQSILNIWKDTKFVREKNYGGWMEVKYNDYMNGKISTIKKVK